MHFLTTHDLHKLFERYSNHLLNVNDQQEADNRLSSLASCLTGDVCITLEKEARGGNAEAMCLQSARLICGWQCAVDKKGGVVWMENAAGRGNAFAQHTLGGWHEHGAPHFGIPKDLALAIAWYEKAAQQGWGQSQSALGRILFLDENIRERERGWQLLNAAATKGVWSAATIVARAYEVGDFVTKDLQESLRFHQTLASQGCTLSKRKLRESSKARSFNRRLGAAAGTCAIAFVLVLTLGIVCEWGFLLAIVAAIGAAAIALGGTWWLVNNVEIR